MLVILKSCSIAPIDLEVVSDAEFLFKLGLT